MIEIEQLEEQVSAKGGRAHCGPRSKFVVKKRIKAPASPCHIP